MTYVAVADPLLDSGKPGRSTDIKQMRDNQADHETRILSLEDINNVRISTHFVKNHNYASSLVLTGAVGSRILNDYDRDWYLEVYAAEAEIAEFIGLSATADNHHLQINTTANTATAAGMIVGSLAFNFDLRVKPLTYIARCRQENIADDLVVGFSQFPAIGTLRPTSGCWLELSGGDWRFSCASASSYTNGSAITEVTAGTWFEVKIVFTDTPTDRFLCYLDGTLKETFTTAGSLPTARNIYGMVKHKSTTSGRYFDIDRLDIYAGGPITDMP